jgi:predicted O-methyltransferase YrrM
MADATWEAVDRFFEAHLPGEHAALTAALADSAAAGLPAISVAPMQGRLLGLLALTVGARRILEIGTLGGYSTIWLARTLPTDGRLITLEYDPRHAEVARRNIDRAALSAMVEIRVGRAIDVLPTLADQPEFDFAFIDADKAGTADYFDWAMRLVRPGGLIVVDNVVRGGAVVDPGSTDAGVIGIRRFFERMARDPRASGAALQTVGIKGYDGLCIVRVERSE